LISGTGGRHVSSTVASPRRRATALRITGSGLRTLVSQMRADGIPSRRIADELRTLADGVSS
jgi:hypothetical protein